MNLFNRPLFKKIRKALRFLQFVSEGREGAVIYNDGIRQIRFYMGYGGNDVVFYLDTPSKADWEKETGFSLNEREDILQYVAKGTQKAQAPSCYYQINETDIVFIKK